MTKHQPYHLEQAQQLLETGQCHFPLTWDDIAARVARHDTFGYALKQAHQGNHRVLEMLVVTAANNLCKEQDNAS